MGDRESPERPGEGEAAEGRQLKEKPGFFSLKNTTIVVAGIALSAILALLIVGFLIAPAIEQRRVSMKEGMSGAAGMELEDLMFFKIDPLIVNPAGSNGERYLKAVITLEVHDAEIQKELEKRLPQIKNQVNNILSSKSITQVQTNSDRERLRREIQNRINSLLVTGRISNVYLEEFVYQ